MPYVMTINTPGYLPDNEPQTYDTFSEAMMAAHDEIDSLIDSGLKWDSDYSEPDYFRADFTDPNKTHDLGLVLEVARN